MTKTRIYDAPIEERIKNFLKYIKRQSFHAYVKQKMVYRFNELFKEELKNEKN